MNYDEYINDGREHPEPLYLDEALESAINDGNKEAIMIALDRQGRNELTDDISNHLIARGFWLRYKTRLVELYQTLMVGGNVRAIIEEFKKCTRDLDENFTSTFISEDEGHKYDKLSGDDVFREAISSSTETARYIVRIDSDMLKSPEELLDHITMKHHMTIFALERAPAETKIANFGTRTVVVEALQSVISSRIEMIDKELMTILKDTPDRSYL